MKNLDHYLLLSLFGGYVLKLLVKGATLPDAAIVLFLGAAYYLYNSQIQSKEIVQLKQEFKGIQDQLEAIKKSNEDLKNAVAGVKITQGLRNVK